MELPAVVLTQELHPPVRTTPEIEESLKFSQRLMPSRGPGSRDRYAAYALTVKSHARDKSRPYLTTLRMSSLCGTPAVMEHAVSARPARRSNSQTRFKLAQAQTFRNL